MDETFAEMSALDRRIAISGEPPEFERLVRKISGAKLHMCGRLLRGECAHIARDDCFALALELAKEARIDIENVRVMAVHRERAERQAEQESAS
jgi:hypothetical protein